MNRYLKYSVAIHALGILVLILATSLSPKPTPKRLELVVLPKGTSLDAVLTRDTLEAMASNSGAAPARNTPVPSPPPTELPPTTENRPETPSPSPRAETPTPAPTPTVPIETPKPTAAPSATPKKTQPPETPRPTSKPTQTPVKTPRPTATPKPTVKATPKKTPAEPSPTSRKTPKPTASAKPEKTPKGTLPPKTSPTPRSESRKSTPTPRPKTIESAYEIPDTVPDELADAGLPRQTPANAVVSESLKPGERAGVPGVPEGIEGAPLPLDREQSMLSMLYANRVKMLVSRNFSVPPGVNDPDLSCIVEWEILPDGTIQNVRIQKTSGVPQLDSCAVDALRKTGNVGPLPPEFEKRSVWTSLTFFFSADGTPAP